MNMLTEIVNWISPILNRNNFIHAFFFAVSDAVHKKK